MKRDYFAVSLVGSLLMHILLIAVLYFNKLNAKQPIPLQTKPITISLYEEPKKEEPSPQPKKIEKKQKIVQKKQTLRQSKAQVEPKQAITEPIKTSTQTQAQTQTKTQTSQIASEAQQRQTIPNSAATPDQNSDEIKKYLSKVREKLQKNLEYPHFAKKAGIEGIATVHFCIKADGSLSIHSLKIIKSSGSSVLDKQALQTVENSAPFTAPPKGEIEVSLPVSFVLDS